MRVPRQRNPLAGLRSRIQASRLRRQRRYSSALRLHQRRAISVVVPPTHLAAALDLDSIPTESKYRWFGVGRRSRSVTMVRFLETLLARRQDPSEIFGGQQQD